MWQISPKAKRAVWHLGCFRRQSKGGAFTALLHSKGILRSCGNISIEVNADQTNVSLPVYVPIKHDTKSATAIACGLKENGWSPGSFNRKLRAGKTRRPCTGPQSPSVATQGRPTPIEVDPEFPSANTRFDVLAGFLERELSRCSSL